MYRLVQFMAATIGVTAVIVGAAPANASTQDERLLEVVANLDIDLVAPTYAIALGKGVCGGFETGVRSNFEPADIRAGMINYLTDQGLDDSQAANFMRASVDIYCPEYNDVAGD